MIEIKLETEEFDMEIQKDTECDGSCVGDCVIIEGVCTVHLSPWF